LEGDASCSPKRKSLQAIRLTTQANGGVPLGIAKFQDQTGITKTDWGKYWARFGDAQREAGFEANTLNTAFDDDYLFEKYIAFARELGRVPVCVRQLKS
jgi:hypothetical protein